MDASGSSSSIFREPDAHLGLVLFSFSMGQLLCSAMIGAGILLGILFYRMAGQHPRKKG